MSLLLVRGARIATAAFSSPLDISGLQLWLDASDASMLFQDAAKTTPATLDGDVIGAWADKSGNVNDATQATTANKPILKLAIQNGKSVVRFDGVNDWLSNSLLALGTQSTIFAVAKNTGVFYERLFNGSIVDNYIFFGALDGNFATFWGNGVAWNDTNANIPAIAVTTFKILATVNDGATATPYVNGAAQNTKDGTTVSFSGYLLSAYGPGYAQNWTGDIAELLIYNSALSAANRQAVEAYLNTRWAIY